jgi:hypothetical protein
VPNYRVQKSSTVAAEWATYVLPMFQYIATHPGCDLGMISTAICSGDSLLAARMLQAIDRAGGVYRGYDTYGNEAYFTHGVMEYLMISTLPAARAWLITHDGATTRQMASDIGCLEAVANKLAEVMAAEADVKLTPE